LRIGELARRTGLSRDTLRFYEREGLIASRDSAEASNDYRDYSEALIERLEMIGQARAAGLSVADLAKLFGYLDALDEDPGGAERFLEEKARELRTMITQAKRLLRMLERTQDALNRSARPRSVPRRRVQKG